MKLRPLHDATILALASLAIPAHSVELGAARLRSGLGQPLRVEIPIGQRASGDGDACARVGAPIGQAGLPELSGARVAVRQGAAGAFAEIRTDRPVVEPLVAFRLEVGCDSRVSRDYVLMVDPLPAVAPVELPRAVPTPAPNAGAPAEWRIARGESLASLAAALYPDSARMRKEFISGVRRANAGVSGLGNAEAVLPEGLSLQIPDLRQVPSAPASTQRAPARVQSKPQSQAAVARAEQVKRPSANRITVGTVPEQVVRELEAKARAQGVNVVGQAPAAVIDPEIAAINRRIKDLELVEAKLRAQIAEIDARLAIAKANAVIAAMPAPSATPVASQPNPLQRPRLWADLILVGGVGAAAATAALAYRRRRSMPEKDREAGNEGSRVKPAGVDFDPFAGDEAHSGIQVRDLTVRSGTGGERVADSSDAASLSVLSHYLDRCTPHRSAPWLAFLEGFRRAGMREEYESLGRRVTASCNVRVPAWSEPFEAVESEDEAVPVSPVENFPHIVARLQADWASPSCRDYLNQLLKDNRDGRRSGFPMEALGDILMLISVLEQRLEDERATPDLKVIPGSRRAA